MADAETKMFRQLHKIQKIGEETAAPAMDIYGRMPEMFSSALSELKPGRMRGAYDTSREGLMSTLSRGGASLGSRTAALGNLDQNWWDNLQKTRLARSQMYGGLFNQAMGAGEFGARMRIDPLKGFAQAFGAKAEQDRAEEAAKAKATGDMWSTIAEGAFDVAAAIATGGATIPLSAAKWAGKAGAMDPTGAGNMGGVAPLPKYS